MNRHQAREIAFQMIFQMDVGNNSYELAENTLENALEEKWINYKDAEYVRRAVQGVIAHKDDLDSLIEKFVKNWSTKRLNPVDKNLIRLGLYEIKYCDEIPTQVAINEAVEIAKIYGTDDSYAFVNGILDNARKSIEVEVAPTTENEALTVEKAE